MTRSLSRSAPRIRHTALLSAYVAPEVVAHILSNGRTPLVSGVQVPVTVLFADIRNFTRFAHRVPAERVVRLLDQHFAAMTRAASVYEAMIDKLIGDAIMLVFGVPSARGDEALRALSSAAAMHSGFNAVLARWPSARHGAFSLGLAIGVASGDAVLANVGSATRMDYTVIGRAVNLAARLTAAAHAGETLASATVRSAARATGSGTMRFGRVRSLALKGFGSRVAAYPVRPTAPPVRARAPATLVDPVCGMKLAMHQTLPADYGGATFYFCSPRCRTAFRHDPLRFIAPAPRLG